MNRVPAVGAVVRDDAGRWLLVKRAHPPAQGLWSLPGGRVDPDEDPTAAVVRELLEETGLHVEVVAECGRLEIVGDGVVYDVVDYTCRVSHGTLVAGDDATDARWVPTDELLALPTAPSLLPALRTWGLLAEQEEEEEGGDEVAPRLSRGATDQRGAGTGRPG